jgi:hypothetical protein
MAQATPPAQPLLKAAELDQLVAPIALYSDPLLVQVLTASTYPLEVVQADRWAKANKGLKGDKLTAALTKQSWDDSIKSLAQVPSVLTMMSDQLDWTQKLGDAMLAQQADVMDAVQRLRSRAQANGNLKSTKEQTVTVKTEAQKQYVVIEPSSPTEIYVPYYEPAVVYGAWPYPAYPPYYWPPAPGYVAGTALAAGIAFGTGVAISHAVWGNCDWGRHDINVAVNRPVNITNVNRGDLNFSKWEHNSDHRHGVKYNNIDVRQKYAKTDIQAGKQVRQDFRGKEGEKVLDPARDRPGAGDRDRPAAGERDRPSAGDRANVGDRDRPDAARDRGPRDQSKGRDTDTRRDANKDRGKQPQTGKASRPAATKQSSGAKQQPRDNAFANVHSGPTTRAQADRGRQSYGGGGGGPRHAAGGGGGGGRHSSAGGRGGPRVSGGGRGGGGRRR